MLRKRYSQPFEPITIHPRPTIDNQEWLPFPEGLVINLSTIYADSCATLLTMDTPDKNDARMTQVINILIRSVVLFNAFEFVFLNSGRRNY